MYMCVCVCVFACACVWCMCVCERGRNKGEMTAGDYIEEAMNSSNCTMHQVF